MFKYQFFFRLNIYSNLSTYIKVYLLTYTLFSLGILILVLTTSHSRLLHTLVPAPYTQNFSILSLHAQKTNIAKIIIIKI